MRPIGLSCRPLTCRKYHLNATIRQAAADANLFRGILTDRREMIVYSGFPAEDRLLVVAIS
jgi:hypothetical protein